MSVENKSGKRKAEIGNAEAGSTMLRFLASEIAKAESELSAREDMEKGWASGTNADWDAARKMHPSTRHGRGLSKAERLEESKRQGHIAEKCRNKLNILRGLRERLAKAEELIKSHGNLLKMIEAVGMAPVDEVWDLKIRTTLHTAHILQGRIDQAMEEAKGRSNEG